mmetsp:Transcript_70792/g.163664  ORF Transcript_70792/g.163664 Transcript_70792/m.163664 type:complete len:265 (+) Transcript_70792:2467-3261(+)
MCCQSQHDQVSVRAVQEVPNVWVILRLRTLQSDELHDLVLPLAGNICIREDDARLELLPQRVVGGAVMDVVADCLGHLVQEIGARCDDIGVEKLSSASVRQRAALGLPILPQLFLFTLHLLTLLCCSKSTSSLLVHLCTRSHTVDGHVDHLLWPGDADEAIQVEENILVHVFLVLGGWPIFWMAAGMDDAVHVQVEVVKLAVWRILVEIYRYHAAVHLHGLSFEGVSNNLWVAHAEPSEERGNPHLLAQLIPAPCQPPPVPKHA